MFCWKVVKTINVEGEMKFNATPGGALDIVGDEEDFLFERGASANNRQIFTVKRQKTVTAIIPEIIEAHDIQTNKGKQAFCSALVEHAKSKLSHWDFALSFNISHARIVMRKYHNDTTISKTTLRSGKEIQEAKKKAPKKQKGVKGRPRKKAPSNKTKANQYSVERVREREETEARIDAANVTKLAAEQLIMTEAMATKIIVTGFQKDHGTNKQIPPRHYISAKMHHLDIMSHQQKLTGLTLKANEAKAIALELQQVLDTLKGSAVGIDEWPFPISPQNYAYVPSQLKKVVDDPLHDDKKPRIWSPQRKKRKRKALTEARDAMKRRAIYYADSVEALCEEKKQWTPLSRQFTSQESQSSTTAERSSEAEEHLNWLIEYQEQRRKELNQTVEGVEALNKCSVYANSYTPLKHDLKDSNLQWQVVLSEYSHFYLQDLFFSLLAPHLLPL